MAGEVNIVVDKLKECFLHTVVRASWWVSAFTSTVEATAMPTHLHVSPQHLAITILDYGYGGAVQQVVGEVKRKEGRRSSSCKLKRTDTTLDLSQKAKRAARGREGRRENLLQTSQDVAI